MPWGVRAHRWYERRMRIDDDQLHGNRRGARLLAFLQTDPVRQAGQVEARVYSTQREVRSSARHSGSMLSASSVMTDRTEHTGGLSKKQNPGVRNPSAHDGPRQWLGVRRGS